MNQPPVLSALLFLAGVLEAGDRLRTRVAQANAKALWTSSRERFVSLIGLPVVLATRSSHVSATDALINFKVGERHTHHVAQDDIDYAYLALRLRRCRWPFFGLGEDVVSERVLYCRVKKVALDEVRTVDIFHLYDIESEDFKLR